MQMVLEKLTAHKRKKELWKSAEQLRNSEYKNETVNYIYEMITKGEYENA